MRRALLYLLFVALFLGTGTTAFGGEWLNDRLTGCAVWQGHGNPPPNLTVTWSGACVAGKASGTGVIELMVEDEAVARFEGEVSNGKPNGRGRFSMSSGDNYEGYFRDGKFDGQGILVSADGARYEGEFQSGAFHGVGVLTFPDGRRYVGTFRNGTLTGE